MIMFLDGSILKKVGDKLFYGKQKVSLLAQFVLGLLESGLYWQCLPPSIRSARSHILSICSLYGLYLLEAGKTR